jgi:hypothetical protein
MPSAEKLAAGVLYVPDSFIYTATFDGTNGTAFAKVGAKPMAVGPAVSLTGP